METSKLLDRFDFFKLDRRSRGFNELLADFFDDEDNAVDVCGDATSLILFISVAEEANEESKEIKSVLVQTMPAFFEGVTHGDNMLGFSEARRSEDACGIGVSVVDTKSENLLLEYL